MQTVHRIQRASPDGKIVIEIADAKAGEEYEVTVHLMHLTPKADAADNEWRRFVRRVSGAFPDLEVPKDSPPPPIEPL